MLIVRINIECWAYVCSSQASVKRSRRRVRNAGYQRHLAASRRVNNGIKTEGSNMTGKRRARVSVMQQVTFSVRG